MIIQACALQASLQDIAIMSLGTGIAQSACMKTSRRGSVGWAKDAVKALMGSAPELNEAILDSLYYVGQVQSGWSVHADCMQLTTVQ